jgi:hypothetical protein
VIAFYSFFKRGGGGGGGVVCLLIEAIGFSVFHNGCGSHSKQGNATFVQVCVCVCERERERERERDGYRECLRKHVCLG